MTEQMPEEVAKVAAELIIKGQAIVCYAKCWPCNFGQCPGGWHTWADEDDVEHAKAAGHADPTKQPCGCWCVKQPAGSVPEPEEPIFAGRYPDDESGLPACPVCGEGGACGYDAEGRPLIHTTDEFEDGEQP